ncbi:uncharacterized protein METZ01_LOCUS119286 [marine metagenome]|uniref:Uncharacterized protein n=1 Tax=marine metagenome TaxID=408172 RepID=A0A381XPM6_9ZZZZ
MASLRLTPVKSALEGWLQPRLRFGITRLAPNKFFILTFHNSNKLAQTLRIVN